MKKYSALNGNPLLCTLIINTQNWKVKIDNLTIRSYVHLNATLVSTWLVLVIKIQAEILAINQPILF